MVSKQSAEGSPLLSSRGFRWASMGVTLIKDCKYVWYEREEYGCGKLLVSAYWLFMSKSILKAKVRVTMLTEM